MIHHEYFAEQQEPLSLLRAHWDRSARLHDQLQYSLLSAVDRCQQGLFQTLIGSRLQAPTPQDWQDVVAQQTLGLINACCEIQAATTQYWLDSFFAPTVPSPLKPALDDTKQPDTDKPQPAIEAESNPEETVTQPVPTPKAAASRRATKPKTPSTKGASKTTSKARKPANNTSGKNASAETAKQAVPTPPLPLKMPKAGSAATPHTQAAAIAQPTSADDAEALAANSDKNPDPQS
ncbi:hypothetical protein [Pseudomonas saliphila]|uniref:hypothetical protein n=1 Tax=Pseudomonas saliphila TaxID=2586906 RepID=UPI00123C4B60|nr:hypothetical protein [Pseudomonas saliphila]